MYQKIRRNNIRAYTIVQWHMFFYSFTHVSREEQSVRRLHQKIKWRLIRESCNDPDLRRLIGRDLYIDQSDVWDLG